MAIYLGLTLFSFLLTSITIIPYIDYLYQLHFFHPKLTSPKTTIPVGGGILIIFIVSVLFGLLFPVLQRFGIYITSVFPFKHEINILFFTFISFGLVGFLSDMVDIFHIQPNHLIHKLLLNRSLLQLVFSIIPSLLLFHQLNIQIINIPFFGVVHLGYLFVPISSLIIFFFSHSVRISDGLDGLASGVLLISLLTFWGISFTVLDTPLSVFIALWIGALLAFLYFNVYPARIHLGQAGALSFGATLAVTGLLLGKISALFLIGGVFFVESLAYLLKSFIGTSSLHGYLLKLNWPEPKVVLRMWLAAVILSLVGLWFALS